MPRMKQYESKKTRLTPRELSHDREAGDSGSACGRNLRERAPKIRNEEQEVDLGGDTRTSSDDDVEDENYVDPNVFHVQHHGKGPAIEDEDDEDEEDEEEDLGGQERDEDEDPTNEDDDDGACRLKVVKPIYMFPNNPIKYHGAGMTKKLQKLRDKDPYASERTATNIRFWATFQQDYYATVIIKKPKITHMAQYVDCTYMESKNDPIFTGSALCVVTRG
jgi:hypothetical protein